MKYLKQWFVLSAALMMFTISGCAGNSKALPTMDEMTNLKGQNAESIIKQFGQPDRKYSDSNSNQVWEYKRPAASQGGTNAFMAIGTFGMASGANSMYVDIMRLTFSRGVVANYALEENTMNVSIPGMTNAQVPPAMPVDRNYQEATPKVKPVAVPEKAQPVESVAKESEPSVANQNPSPSSTSMVVINSKAKLRKSPSAKAAVIKTLKKGEEVQVIKLKDGWCLVELAGGETGWCLKGALAQKN